MDNRGSPSLQYDIDDPRFRIHPSQQMVSACSGALLTSLFMTPLDVVKTRLQAQQKLLLSNKCFLYCNGLMDHLCPCGTNGVLSRTPHLNGTIDAFVKISQGEGVKALWSGLSPTLVLALPTTVIYFVAYEQLRVRAKDRHMRFFPEDHTTPWWIALGAGSAARIIAASIVSPLELVRTKMQSQKLSYWEVRQALKSMINTQGILGLWTGLRATLMRDVPFSGIYWTSYESFKGICGVTGSPSLTFSFFGGALSGSIAAILTTPFDVVKTHKQIELGEKLIYTDTPKKIPKSDESVLAALEKIYKLHGIRGLFAGIIPRLVKVAPACAIMLSSFEYAPISVDFRGSGTISSSRLGIIYSILVAIAYGSFHVASSIFNLSEKEEHNIITNVINYYNRYSRLVLFWVCIGNALINQRRIIQTFNLIENVDKLFATELNIHSNHAKFSRLVFLEIFIYLLSVFALEWNNCLMYISGIGIFNNYCMSMCLIPLIVATADQILFINLVYLIKERLAIISGFLTTKQRRVIKVKEGHKINGHLLKTVHMLYHFEHEVENLKVKMVQSKNTRVYIKTASVGYSRLYEASNLLNCAYGIPNAYTIFIRFVSLTTLAYSSCMRVLRLDDNDAEHIKKVPGIIGWIMLNFTEMLIFCLMCHRMKEEAAIIGRQLQCFRVENCHAPDVDEAIGVFSHQIHHQRIEITPCGFFTVDLSFIFALIATVTTYIMILIQFDISQKQLVNQK